MPQAELLVDLELSDALSQIIDDAPLPDLDANPKCTTTAERICRLVDHHPQLPLTCQAGLWLLAGDLDRSHQISQTIESPSGAFWHAIMHRREGDFWNSKYWFRRTGSHRVHDQLAQHFAVANMQTLSEDSITAGLTNSRQISDQLVDYCEQCLKQAKGNRRFLQTICWWQWQLLWHHCYKSDLPESEV